MKRISYAAPTPLTLSILFYIVTPMHGQLAEEPNTLLPKPTADSRVMDEIVLTRVATETFENGIVGWTMTDPSAWSITKEKNGNHVFGLNRRQSDYKPRHRSPLNIALMANVQVSDFVLTFDVRSTKDTGNHRDCCVFFAYQNPEQFYYAHLGAKPDPASGQIMIVNKAPRTPLTKNENTVGWDDKWHRVKVTRNSKTGTIKVFFDDLQRPIMETTDQTYGSGKIGIGSFDDMNDFDNIHLFGR
ncbi:MAG: hypothetical protein MK106_13440 [Mariniblastus sp.]|nr:hypothetical protein [Mariniblastus sp.]